MITFVQKVLKTKYYFNKLLTKNYYMKTILIPIDFSEGSLNSCKYAIGLLGNETATMHLFHIYNDQVMIPDSSFPSGMDTDAFFNSNIILALKEQAEQNIKEFSVQLEKIIKKKGCNIKLENTLMGGDPQWKITETTEELHPDLVIMGTRGYGKKGFLEGNIAEKIMSKAPVPILAVPERFTSFHLKNIMYPTNFNQLDVHTLKRVFNMFAHLDFKFHVCHFLMEKEKENVNTLMKDIKIAFEKERLEGRIKFFQIQTNDKNEALETFANNHNIDLIAFLSGKKHLIKHLFSSHKLRKKDFFKLELPLLAMHE